MTRRTRTLVFVPFGAAALAGVIVAMVGLPAFGDGRSAYGDWVTRHTVPARGATDAVTAATFDIRGFDTLGEELILFSAAAACVLLLRAVAGDRPDHEQRRALTEGSSVGIAPLRALAAALLAPTAVLGANVISHGQITPGGGFQGGVIVATFLLLLLGALPALAASGDQPAPVLETVEAVGACAFALLGIGGLVFATAAFENFLGNGTTGDLVSAGTIPLLSVAVGIEVTAAFALIFAELLQQALVRGSR